MALVDIIAGARPNFMKIAPIIKAIDSLKANNKLTYRLIHTGQHYDAKMSGDFFEQLGIPKPSINLEVGSGTQAEQTAAIMISYEKVLLKSASDLCLVVGDVTSTMACAITAQKLCIPVAHVEGGIRSGDWTMPEEINRLVTDAISSFFFTTSAFANANLKKVGVRQEQIFFVGNTMIDTLMETSERMTPPDFWEMLSLEPKNYFLLTLHRPHNVDEISTLSALLNKICESARGKNVVFPIHPRTAKVLDNVSSIPDNLCLVEPQPYLQFGYLAKNTKAVITDSGGVTEEATVNGVPCITLRDSTERPETVEIGTNELIGTNIKNIKSAFELIFSGHWKKGSIPEMWDGKTGYRIARILETIL